MGYTAKSNIDPLDYDFNPFTDAKGTTPEPDSDRIKNYLSSSANMWRRHSEELNTWSERRKELGDTPDPGALEDFNREYETWQSEDADKRLDTRRRLLAMLCSDQPSYEQLCALPGRVFDDFESYMNEQLTPKALRTATS